MVEGPMQTNPRWYRLVTAVIVLAQACWSEAGDTGVEFVGSQSGLECHALFNGLWSKSHDIQGMPPFTADLARALGGKNRCYFLTPLERGRIQVLPVAYGVNCCEWFDTAASVSHHFGSRAQVNARAQWPGAPSQLDPCKIQVSSSRAGSGGGACAVGSIPPFSVRVTVIHVVKP